jgi:DNA-binding transcriptional ArsR family regulator
MRAIVVRAGRRRHRRPWRVAIDQYAYIHDFEYNRLMDSLREFKAQIFQALAHPTRIAVVEALVGGERSAGTLLALLGVEQANLSQHLAVLRAKQVVSARKSGNQVYYTLRDPVLAKVLELLRRYFYQQVRGTAALLVDLEEPPARRRRRA